MQAVSNDTLFSNSTCGRPRPDSFIMLRDPIHSDIPWPGFIIGETIISIWYWCADQVREHHCHLSVWLPVCLYVCLHVSVCLSVKFLSNLDLISLRKCYVRARDYGLGHKV